MITMILIYLYSAVSVAFTLSLLWAFNNDTNELEGRGKLILLTLILIAGWFWPLFIACFYLQDRRRQKNILRMLRN